MTEARAPTSRGARLTGWLARLYPAIWSTFYRRTWVHAILAPEALPALTVDLTRRCNLGCAFCMAADVAGPVDFPARLWPRLADEFAGAPRLTLVGGEPTLHPSFPAILRAAVSRFGEVEVFTNGTALGPDGAAPPAWPDHPRVS